MPEFTPFRKIARLNRDIVITEKIDGTNAAIIIGDYLSPATSHAPVAQSRNRIITPEQDNAGFARWVHENATDLEKALGPGVHFGEWWGSGIQRGYGLDHKRFSLFNTARWADALPWLPVGLLSSVPVLYEGPFSEAAIKYTLWQLAVGGSKAAPGYDKPEGIVVWHTAARTMFKVTLEKDEAPKGIAGA